MANPKIVMREFTFNDEKSVNYLVWCPGCKSAHRFTTQNPDGPTWDFDGNMERPTFSPSLLCYYTAHLCESEHEPQPCVDPSKCGESAHLVIEGSEGERVLAHNTPHTREPAWGNCHSFLRDGKWQFLSDCAHELAGQTVDMEPLPDWLMDWITP